MKFERGPFAAVIALVVIAALGFLGVRAFNRGVHDYIVGHPEVLLEAQAAYARKQDEAMATRAKAVIRARQAEIFADARDPFVGPRDARVSVVQFFDYRCPHCKAEAAPAVEALIRKYPNVKFIFKEWPIFGGPSQTAARAALGAWREGRYLPVYVALMADRDVTPETIDQALRGAGLDPGKTLADAASPEIARQLADVQSLAMALGADGTPAFIVGDTMVPGARMDQVEALIRKGLKG